MVQAEDLILVSVDDHVVEPPNMFDNHLPDKWKDKAPVFLTKDDGTQVWRYEGAEIPNIGLNAVAGRPPEEWGMEPASLEEIREGCYDPDKRVLDMNLNGTLGSMSFPSFVQFCGQLFSRTEDKEQALAMVQAYNDWHIDEWAGSHPERFIPLAIPPIWDAETMAGEIRRVAAKGCRAMTFSENPSKLGWPSFHSDAWDPMWQAASEEGVVLCLHIGSSSSVPFTAPDAPIDVLVHMTPMNSMLAGSDLLWSPVLRKFPDLKFALSEGGIGWVPYFLERADYTYQHHSPWTGQDFGDKLPSQVFLEHVWVCFIDDGNGIDFRDKIGVDNIMWECDYPHSDSSWPQSPELAAKQLAGVSKQDTDQITHLNAMKLFDWDPFSIRPREQCTAGELRKEAEGVDPTTKGRGRKDSVGTGADTLNKVVGATKG
ncbi:MAG: amidohydrolase family protein [Nitriliruptorales bacterium]|nr:amidohydrolase family protein [Nitriliruptorales bacterium]